MPFTENLPPENTDPWYVPLTTVWGKLKTFVNGLESSLATKVGSSNASVNNVEVCDSIDDLPTPGTEGTIYFIKRLTP